MHMHVYIYIYIYVYMYMCVHTYRCIRIYTCVYLWINIYTRMYIHNTCIHNNKYNTYMRANMNLSAHTSVYTYTFIICVYTHPCTGWRRLIGSLIFIGHFLQKWPIFNVSFVENDLQLRGSYESSPPCIYSHAEKKYTHPNRRNAPFQVEISSTLNHWR